MWLAERGTQLNNNLWVREVRHLDEPGHQTAILTTDYTREMSPLSAARLRLVYQLIGATPIPRSQVV